MPKCQGVEWEKNDSERPSVGAVDTTGEYRISKDAGDIRNIFYENEVDQYSKAVDYYALHNRNYRK